MRHIVSQWRTDCYLRHYVPSMSKRLPPDLLQRVIAVLIEHPEGLALAGLEKSLKDLVSRRSLQRRLDHWARKQLINAHGVRRGRRYFSTSGAGESRVIAPPAGNLMTSASPPGTSTGVPI